MNDINVYIEYSQIEDKTGGYAAILEVMVADVPKTMEISERVCNVDRKRLEVLGLAAVLTHIKKPCNICLFTNGHYIYQTIENEWLDKWETSGWTSSKGTAIQNADIWRQIKTLMMPHEIIASKEEHSYRNYLNYILRRQNEINITKN